MVLATRPPLLPGPLGSQVWGFRPLSVMTAKADNVRNAILEMLRSAPESLHASHDGKPWMEDSIFLRFLEKISGAEPDFARHCLVEFGKVHPTGVEGPAGGLVDCEAFVKWAFADNGKALEEPVRRSEPAKRCLSLKQICEFFEAYCGDIVMSRDAQSRPICMSTKLAEMCIEENCADKDKQRYPSLLHPVDPNLYAVTEFFIKPFTNNLHASYAEKMNPDGLEVDFFVSHHWGEDFAEFVQSIIQHAYVVARRESQGSKVAESAEKIAYWVCAFANDQWNVQLGDTVEQSPFYQALSSKNCKGTVMNLNQMVTALNRIWCCYEVLLTHKLEKSFTVNTRLGPLTQDAIEHSEEMDLWVTHMNKALGTFDISRARSSSEEDKIKILSEVQNFQGKGVAAGLQGGEALNLTVKAMLAGQAIFTLARTGDVEAVRRALTMRADPTQYDGCGVRPLTYAAARGHGEVAQLLLESKAEPTAEDGAASVIGMWNGKTSLERTQALKKVNSLPDQSKQIHGEAYKKARERHLALCAAEHGEASHYPKNGGNLSYAPTGPDLRRATQAIERMKKSCDWVPLLNQVLTDEGMLVPQPDGSGRCLMVALTDLEPDDTMGIAELWQMNKDDIDEVPLIVKMADFEDKDKGAVFEKKLFVGALALGITDIPCLLPVDGYPDATEKGIEKAVHVADRRASILQGICKRLASFKGEIIKFYVLGPCHGNIAAILTTLKSMGQWPLSAKWELKLYSGSYNIGGMGQDDFQALGEIWRECSEEPLVDIAKFKFFGEKTSHSSTASFTTFALETFAGQLNFRAPLLAAGLKLLNDEFNARLIFPAEKLFKRKNASMSNNLSQTELAKAMNIESRHKNSIRDYAKAIYEAPELFSKVNDFKKSTLVSFAYDGCDSPLCDQIVFLYEWLTNNGSGSNALESNRAWWHVQHKEGVGVYTYISDESVSPYGIQATQPKMRDPYDEEELQGMRKALTDYFLRHLQELYPPWQGGWAPL